MVSRLWSGDGLAAVIVAVDEAVMVSMRSWTLVKLPRRMAWRVMIPKKIFDHVQPGPEIG
jgi:hypothetical protein